jgi:ABC-type glycerol-3-phosphate transport system substrate-binding protein
MKSFKVIVVMLVLSLIGISALWAGGGKDKPAGAKRPMRIVGPNLSTERSTVDPVSGKTIPGYDEIQAMAEKAFPEFDIQITASPWDGWTTKLQTAAASNLVDIMMHGASITDAVFDLKPFFQADPAFEKKANEELFVPYAYRKADREHFKDYALTGITTNLDATMLIYDKKIFDDYGVPYPDANLTQEKLLEIAQKLTGKDPVTGQNTYGFYIQATQNAIYRPHLAYLFSKDITILDYADKWNETKFYYDSPASVEAFRYANELAKYCPRSFLENRGIENFCTANNNVAMFIIGDIGFYYEKAKGAGVGDRFGFAYPPKIEKGNDGWSTFVGDVNIAIAKNAANKDDAWAFLKWYTTDPGVADWLLRRGLIPNNRKVLDSIIQQKLPYAEPLINILDKYPKNLSQTISKYCNTNFGAGLSIVNKNFSAMFSGTISPEQTARQMQADFLEQEK